MSSAPSFWGLRARPRAGAGAPTAAWKGLRPGSSCACAPSRAPLQVCSKAAALVRGTGPACAKSWIVQPRNTCWAIWTLNNMTQAQFLAKNPGIMCQKLHVGQSVCVA